MSSKTARATCEFSLAPCPRKCRGRAQIQEYWETAEQTAINITELSLSARGSDTQAGGGGCPVWEALPSVTAWDDVPTLPAPSTHVLGHL